MATTEKLPQMPVYSATPGSAFAATGGAIIPQAPSEPLSIGVSDLTTPATPMNLPQAPAVPEAQDYAATIKSLESLFAPSGPTAAETAVGGVRNDIMQTYGDLMGRGAYVKADGTIDKTQATRAAEDRAARELGATTGLGDFNVQLRDITNQIDTLSKEALAIPLQVQEQNVGRGVTSGGIAPIQTGLLRKNAIKALSLTAIAQTLQGNISTAQETAKRAVELEFAPDEAKLAYLTKAYEMNKDELEREDKAKALKLQTDIAERTRLLEEEKTKRLSIQEIALAAAQNGGDAQTLGLIQNAKTVEEAISTASPFLTEKTNQVVNLGNGMAQLIDTKTGKVIATYNGAGVSSSAGGAGGTSTMQGNELIKSARALRYGSVAEANRIIGDVTYAVQNGDIEGAENVLRQFGYQKLPVSTQQDYDLYDNARSAFDAATAQLETSSLNAGPYKALSEAAKPWLNIKRDQDYTELRALIEQGQAQLRKGYYGTAVTGTEAGNAKNFLITDNDDIYTMRWKMQQGAAFLEFVNDAQIARTVGLPKPNLSDYLSDNAADMDDDALLQEYYQATGQFPSGPMSTQAPASNVSTAPRTSTPVQGSFSLPSFEPDSFFSDALGSVFGMFNK